jgi:hypothetical protein
VAGAIITYAERFVDKRKRRASRKDAVIEGERRTRRLRTGEDSIPPRAGAQSGTAARNEAARRRFRVTSGARG